MFSEKITSLKTGKKNCLHGIIGFILGRLF